MNCEQVEELLSAYLDNALAPEEWREVTAHLQTCTKCRAIITEYNRNDSLLSHLPRVSPEPALRDRIFFSPEFLELTGTFDAAGDDQQEWTVPILPSRNPRRRTSGRPQLIAIPGGRSTSPTPTVQPYQPTHQLRNSQRQRVLFMLAAACVILAISIGGLFEIHSWSHQTQSTKSNSGAIPPPANSLPGGPLQAGMRFVFLRDGALWSVLPDGSNKQVGRLTPSNVTVAANWVVNPAQAGRAAGDMVAYIDLQRAFVHVIRSDGQQDTIVRQPLLASGIQPTLIWDTDTGAAILNSLTWSKDGNMLAFVADPTGKGQTRLYIYSTETGITQVVPFSGTGSISHPVWSPDGIRLAYEVTNNGMVSIFDYNTQNQGFLTITSGLNSQAGDGVLTLDWSPSLDEPAITWSVGVDGDVHSLWLHRVGVEGASPPRPLLVGHYSQAIYSGNGHNGAGSWLVVNSVSGRAGDIGRIDVVPGSVFVQLTSGKQVSFAQWSTDGTHIDYLNALSAGVGAFHILNLMTGIDSLVATAVVNEPVPVWSADSHELVYSTGTNIGVVNLQAGNKSQFLKLQGLASTFTWSVNSPHQLVVALSDISQGIYMVDTSHGTSLQVDKFGVSGPLEWTEIP